MPDPITPNDLYGPSNPPAPEGETSSEVTPALPIEETPEITTENSTPPTTFPASPPAPKTSFWSSLGLLILFIGLFGVGVFLSSYLRQYFPNGLVGVTPSQQAAVNAPTSTPTPTPMFGDWKTYQVISGVTKQPVPGVSFKLPPEVTAPTCDNASCMSQGTYLPGGTRFTIAPRGVGQLLADYRGSAISDVASVVFGTKPTTVNGYTALLYTGNFTGSTVGGYGFSQMRGYMIGATSTFSVEINHFTPTGVTANWASDDALFDQIVTTLMLPGAPTASPSVTPLTTTVPVTTSATSPATTSGY